MPGKYFFDDTRRFIHAMLSNQIAKVSPTLYSRLTKKTGRGFSAESTQQAADYFQTCFNDYFVILGIPENEVENFLSGKQLLEYGPGDIPGVALLMIAHGAERVTCVDRFELVTMSQKNEGILLELLGRLEGEARARASHCFLKPGQPGSGFNPDRIRYLIKPSGLSKLNGEIDFIFSRAVLEHVNDLDATFDDMAQALQPNGIVLHQVDLRSHGLHRRNPLDFLTWPTVLWSWMHSNKGAPNRWRVNTYRDTLHRIGFETVLMQPTQLIDKSIINEVRPSLARPFKSLSDVDLSWLGFWLLCRKTNYENTIQ
ncbi:MAG: methyltransferase domain-containing protein [Nitrosomonadales bacterium]|nr:methyltransferase domain-containing protein [Nitrosomonadales bacterium]